MMNTSLKPFLPGRLFLPGCAVAAGLLAVKPSAPAWAAPTEAKAKTPGAAVLLGLGQTVSLPLAAGATFSVESGAENAQIAAQDGTLQIKALKIGEVCLNIQAPDRPLKVLNLRLIDRSQKVQPVISNFATSQVREGSTAEAAPATPVTPTGEGAAPTTEAPVLPQPLTGFSPQATTPAMPSAGPAPTTLPPVDLPPISTAPATPPPISGAEPPAPMAPLPDLTPAAPVSAPPAALNPQISPILPPPVRAPRTGIARLPKGLQASANRPAIPVTQGLARLLSFPSNILAVFFSDQNVMDARAVNARTVAVTGVAPGLSTLAVFTSQFPGDAIGKANIYRIETTSKSSAASPMGSEASMEQAIVAALNDSRIRVSVVRLPDGSNAVRLSGVVRNGSEVQAAATTAAYYLPKVISSIYADPTAPAQGEVPIAPESPNATLQDKLRRITGNESIALENLGGGLIFKASVASTDEADAMMSLLSTINQPVTPFIVVRGADNSNNVYNSPIPILTGENLTMTQNLQAATGVRSVYVLRTATNGLAVYGKVRSRSEFDAVQRYAAILPVVQQGATDRSGAFPITFPATGNSAPLNVQMFVQITDPAQAVLRQVNIETNVVEIARTSLKNLGVEYGSATLLTQNVSAGTAGTPAVPRTLLSQTVDPVTGVITNQTFSAATLGTPAVPGIVTRTIDSTLRQGVLVGGNGFLGSGGFSTFDPFRARLNALYQNGDARLLSRPNVSAIEGATAQITIGGSRPVPVAVASTGGAVGQSVEFRRFGVILTMVPTVTDDNTIILQIRADVTALDPTTGVTVNGALVPGESVRSVDTTLTVHSGDIIVMGGLMTNERRLQTSKVPVLGNLPVIGALFQSKRFENNQSELAIFMTPQLTSVPTTLGTIEAIKRVQALPHLPGVQESRPILSTTGGGSGSTPQ